MHQNIHRNSDYYSTMNFSAVLLSAQYAPNNRFANIRLNTLLPKRTPRNSVRTVNIEEWQSEVTRAQSDVLQFLVFNFLLYRKLKSKDITFTMT